jgi:hypothetical protein
MQYVNDDMDDLFRRAAEDYPLDTSGADWKKVLTMLEGENGGKGVSEKKPNKNGRLLWLLLLLPLGLVCNQLYTPSLFNSSGAAHIDKSKTAGTGDQSTTGRASNDLKVSTNAIGVKEAPLNPGSGDDNKEKNGSSPKSIALVQEPVRGSSAKKTTNNQKTISSQNYIDRDRIASPDGAEPEKLTQEAGLNAPRTLLNRPYVPGVATRSVTQKPVVIADRTFTPAVAAVDVNSNPKVSITNPKRFYAGLIGGIDATTVKLQKVSGVGFSFGALVGYQINKKWSVETGALIEKKYYYTDGKYFNNSKIPYPALSWMDDIYGNCKMIEVPISAKYIFATHAQSSWFGTMGLSSYIMKEENYSYEYYPPPSSSYPPTQHHKVFKNSSSHLFSNVSVSGGYTRRLGNFADVRVEPYLKLPISSVGIGSLPLFSMGLQVGITKKF